MCDYRELEGEERFDKVASIGMVEHVASAMLEDYFRHALRLLRPRGTFLCHGIASRVDRAPRKGPSFVQRYVFPDGELVPIGKLALAAETAGFEVRDVEGLREHYVLTLERWRERLEARREDAVRAAGETSYRVFRLYLAGSAHGFRTGRIGVYQTLLVKPEAGASGLPLTRDDWYASARKLGPSRPRPD